MPRAAIGSIVVLFVLTNFLAAKYKPNGPPLYVCEGAVPLEPNTDKLKQFFFQNAKWDKRESRVIIATTQEQYKKGWALLGQDKIPAFDNDHIYVFYCSGAVAERKGKGLPTLMQTEVFGVERTYSKRSAKAIMDHVIFHLVARDIDSKRPMPAHSPAVFYSIRKDKLDTEYNGTPPITKSTVFEAHELRVTGMLHVSQDAKPDK